MAVAHSEAVLAVLDACTDRNEDLDADRAIELLAGIATALCWGPPALATDQRLQATAAKCLEVVPQVGGLWSGGCSERLYMGGHGSIIVDQ